MGAGGSAFECNDDLVDNLMEGDYIKSVEIERVFRAVDRGAYFIADSTVNAYRDVAWKNGNFHISAPCIYSEVMEGLKLKPGLSFLNLGSGTGYLSTMVGLMLGSNGVNHGIELHEDVVQYAIKKVEEFKKYSGALDEYDFCEPKFMQGNCLSLASGGHLYDRVYCGAACPEPYLNYVKTLIKPGGILIVPLNDQLLEMTRISERSFRTLTLLPVSFATLVQPPAGNEDLIKLFDIQPLSLQELCRATVRNLLRKIISIENPEVQKATKDRPKKKKRGSKRGRRSKRKGPKPATEELFDHLMQTVAHQKSVFQSAMRHRLQYDRNLALQARGLPPEPLEPIQADPRYELRYRRRSESSESGSGSGSGSEESDASEDPFEEPINKMHDVFLEIIGNLGGRSSSSSANQEQASTSTSEETNDDAQEGGSNSMTVEAIVEHSDNQESTDDKTDKEEKMVVEDDGKRKEEEISGSSSAPEAKRKNNRDKFDSGLGDDLISEISGSDNTVGTVNNNSSDDDSKKTKVNATAENSGGSSKSKKMKKVDSGEDSGDENDPMKEIKRKMYKSPYSPHMKSKIEQLPLPSILKKYLHFYREL